MPMLYTMYETGLVGTLTLTSAGELLDGCWFEVAWPRVAQGFRESLERRDDLPAFAQATAWLDRYFAGDAGDPRDLPLGGELTEFQRLVRDELLDIPYGRTTTYGDIAARIARRTGRRQSARAVGGAVGRNPLGVIVPCHRVLASDGSLRGYAGGVDRKEWLLKREGVNVSGLSTPPAADDGGGRRE